MGLIGKIDNYLTESKVGETILKQIRALDKYALPAWGAKNYVSSDNGIQFDVNGPKFRGRIIIAYNRGSDTYVIEMGRITRGLDWKQHRVIKQVFAGDLVNILDQHIG